MIYPINQQQLKEEKPSGDSGSLDDKEQLISYQIIKRDTLHKFKESYDIRVDLVEGRLPNEKELEAVSATLRNKSFDKTFICFHLTREIDYTTKKFKRHCTVIRGKNEN